MFFPHSWAVPKRRNSGISGGIFFYNLQNIPPRNFYQKLKSASDREFYSLYDAIHEFTKFEFS
jgi:hypothetical protein